MTGVVSIHSNLVHNALKYKGIAFLINFLENSKQEVYTFLKGCYNKGIRYRWTAFWKVGDCMTGKEIVNLIRQLRADGMSDSKILNLIEYIETHDPKEQEDDEAK